MEEQLNEYWIGINYGHEGRYKAQVYSSEPTVASQLTKVRELINAEGGHLAHTNDQAFFIPKEKINHISVVLDQHKCW